MNVHAADLGGLLRGEKENEGNTMSPKQVATIIVTFLLIASGIWLGQNRQFYTEAVVSIFFACTLISVSVIHLRILPNSCITGSFLRHGFLSRD